MSQGKKWRDKERKRRAKNKRQPFIPEPGLSESEVERIIERKVQVIPPSLPTRMHLSTFSADTLEVGTTAVVPENTITSDEITPIAGNNLLLDPSFEDESPDIEYDEAFSMWSAIGDTGMRDTAEFYRTHGGACFHMEGGGSNPSIVMQGGGEFNEYDIPVEENSPYSSSCQIMYMGEDGRAFFRIVWLDNAHDEISTEDGMKVTVLEDGMWTRAEQPNMISPAGAKYARWQVVVTASGGTVPEWHIDSCQFEEGTIPTAFNPISTRGRSVLSIKGGLLFGNSEISNDSIIFHESAGEGFETPFFRQARANQGTSGTASTSWSGDTLAGSLLVAFLTFDDADGTPPSASLPAGGWREDVNEANGGQRMQIFTLENAVVKNGALNITLNDTVDWILQLFELPGASVVDKVSEANGTSTSIDTGTTATTTQADEYWLAFTQANQTDLVSAWTNSFTGFWTYNVDFGSGQQIAANVAHKYVSSVGTANTTGTIPVSTGWIGAMICLKNAPNEASPPGDDKIRLFSGGVYDDTELFTINSDSMVSALSEAVGPGPDTFSRKTWVYHDGHNNFTSNIAAGTSVQVGQFEYLVGSGTGSLIGDNADATVNGAHILRMGTTAGATSRAHIRGTRDWPGANASRVRMGFRVKVPTGHGSNATDRYDIGFGIYDQNDFRAVTNGIFVRYSDSKATPAGTNSTWDLVHCNASTRSADALNDNGGEITLGTDVWYTIELDIIPSLGTSVWINGVKKVTNYNTNLPAAIAGSGFRAGIVRVAGSSNTRDVYVDYMWYEATLASQRT